MRPAANTPGSGATVTPAPALGANKTRHRSDGNYVKRYGRTSFESHKARHEQSSKPSQEPLKQFDSNAVEVVRGADSSSQSSAPLQISGGIPLHLSLHHNSDAAETSVSPLTPPSLSQVSHARLTSLEMDNASQEDLVGKRVASNSPSSLLHLPLHVDPSDPATSFSSDLYRKNAEPVQCSTTGSEKKSVGTPARLHRSRIDEVLASSPQSLPKASSTAEKKHRPANAVSRTATSDAHTTSSGLRRTPSGYPHQRSAPQSSASSAPRQHAASATTASGAGRRANAVSASSSSANTKARSGLVVKRKMPPSSQPLTNAVVEASGSCRAVAPTLTPSRRTRSPDAESTSRYELVQTRSVLDYVAEVMTALSERRRCAAPPTSTEGFRASVVPCRRRVGTADSQEESERDEDDSPEPIPHAHNKNGSIALLPALHLAAGRLLSAFTRLEYVQLSNDVDMLLLERDAVEHSAELLRLVDGVERQLSLDESLLVREGLAERRYMFRAMHRLVRFMVRMMHEMVVLRDLAERHDLDQVEEVWDSFRRNVEAESQVAPECIDNNSFDRADHADAQASPSLVRKQLVDPRTMVLASPFFSWLVERWLPAMRQWRKLVLDAHRAARNGDVDGAVRRSRQEALQIDGLREILRRGETMSELQQAQVEQPLKEIANMFVLKQAVMDELRAVLESPEASNGTLSAVKLSKALKAAQAFAAVRTTRGSGEDTTSSTVSCDVEDTALVNRAEELFTRLQMADVLHCAIKATLQDPAAEMVTELEHITRANELLLFWRLAKDARAALTARAVGRAALDAYRQRQRSLCLPERMSGLSTSHGDVAVSDCLSATSGSVGTSAASVRWIGDEFPAFFDVHTLYIAHSPSGPWSCDLRAAYKELCEAFAVHYIQGQAQRELERALVVPSVGGQRTKLTCAHSSSPQSTPRRPTRDAASPADTLRLSDDGSNAYIPRLVASLGGTTSTCSVDDTSSPARSTANALNAEELRRCIQQAEESGVSGALIEEARAQLRRLDTLRLKIHFDAQTRMLPISDAAKTDFCVVYQQIHDLCLAQQEQQSSSSSVACERRLRIRYEDPEGDFISLLDQQDWDMMLSELAPHGCGKVKIELFCDYPTMPGNGGDSTCVTGADGGAVPNTSNESEPTGEHPEAYTDPAESAAWASGSTMTAQVLAQEKRPNVFGRLASAPKNPTASTATCAQRKSRPHPHSLQTISPQRALAPPRARATGATRSVSPQKGCSSRRTPGSGAGNDATKGKVSALPAPASGSLPKTVALTAENLRRNMLLPQVPSVERDAEAATQKEVQRSGVGASDERAGGVSSAAPEAADCEPSGRAVDQASGEKIDSSVKNSSAGDDRGQGADAFHLNLHMARRWEATGDDELHLCEMQTCASMSTVRPGRSTAKPESMERMALSPTEVVPKVGSVRNTFTATYCSGKAERVSGGGDGGYGAVMTGEAVREVGEKGEAKTRRPPALASREPRRWSADEFSLDEVETVCSDRSRIPRQIVVPKGPLCLPPRPVNVAVGGGGNCGGIPTPQRARRGARGTPIRSRSGCSEDARGGKNEEGENTSEELFAAMERLREANTRAIEHRKSPWH